jgi:hypothetical protein
MAFQAPCMDQRALWPLVGLVQPLEAADTFLKLLLNRYGTHITTLDINSHR